MGWFRKKKAGFIVAATLVVALGTAYFVDLRKKYFEELNTKIQNTLIGSYDSFNVLFNGAIDDYKRGDTKSANDKLKKVEKDINALAKYDSDFEKVQEFIRMFKICLKAQEARAGYILSLRRESFIKRSISEIVCFEVERQLEEGIALDYANILSQHKMYSVIYEQKFSKGSIESELQRELIEGQIMYLKEILKIIKDRLVSMNSEIDGLTDEFDRKSALSLRRFLEERFAPQIISNISILEGKINN
ncbi:hypothetical protein HZA97_05805 [Candidatus Woesearchaeota archaeon]|nr:hypothetical protein [Candidatus Woesearchaeota archaeon]